MEFTITAQNIITAAAVLAAIVAIFSRYNKGYDFVQEHKDQKNTIREMQEEQALLTYGVLACLKGLKEQGCNGPVTEAINKIEKHLNEKAHSPK